MPETATVNYLDPQTLAAVGTLELRARMIVEGLMTGMHRSPYQGFSVEFAQHRQYAPGDDIRHLDWKVFGRSDKLYLKQYQKETNLDLVLLVDTSGSMAYSSVGDKSSASDAGRSGAAKPTWSKYDHASCLAAAMAYLALHQQDRVGLVLFDETTRLSTRLSNSHDHWRGLVEALVSEQPQDSAANNTEEDRPTDLGRVFDEILAKLQRRSIIVLISDLFDDPAVLENALARLHHRRHDLIVLQTLDPAELDFPFRSPADFMGLEGEGKLGLDPAAIRKAYLEVMQRHLNAVEQVTRRFRFDHLMLNTAAPIGPAMSHFLARRSAMAGRRR